MQDYIELDGIDVTSYRLKWRSEEEWGSSIQQLEISFGPRVREIVDIRTGLSITVQRGFVTATDKYVFRGQITQVYPGVSAITLICKGKLYEAIKGNQTKSWDINVDTEAGVGSEIVKAILDNSQLSYSSASIQSTGTAAADKLQKFIQRDEDDYDRLLVLSDIYNFNLTYNPDDDLVYFQQVGFTTYPVSLTVGTDIPAQIEWRENMEQLCNKVKAFGATGYDTKVETFVGPATEFTLSSTPEDTEVRINHATTDDLQVRGQKDLGVIGTDFDYYVDTELKKVVFSGNVSDVYIRYGAQVPIPVILTNVTSIEEYGGPKKTPHSKKKVFNDVKDVNDVEKRGRAFLNKYSTPFIEADEVPVIDSVIQTNGDIAPGNLITIVDNYTQKNYTVFVKEVIKSFPHVYDKITIGDEIWRTTDWDTDQMKKINKIFNELNKNQDILIEVIDVNRTHEYERMYVAGYKKDRSSDGDSVFILGHPTFGKLGTQKLGDAGDSWSLYSLVQHNNIYREFFDTEDFKYTGNGIWSTSGHYIRLPAGRTFLIGPITYGHAYNYFTATFGSLIGAPTIEITGNLGDTFQTIVPGQRTAFISTGTNGVYMRITYAGGGSYDQIGSTFKDDGSLDQPGIKVILE